MRRLWYYITHFSPWPAMILTVLFLVIAVSAFLNGDHQMAMQEASGALFMGAGTAYAWRTRQVEELRRRLDEQEDKTNHGAKSDRRS